LINCRCGSQHLDRFDSLDQCNVTTFYQHQIAFPTTQSSPEILPRTPSLPSMMLHTMDENIVTFLITGFLRQYKFKGIEQLLSFYLLGYRCMRVSKVFLSPFITLAFQL
jgi:prolipoprotein diacylglyceryltransferase